MDDLDEEDVDMEGYDDDELDLEGMEDEDADMGAAGGQTEMDGRTAANILNDDGWDDGDDDDDDDEDLVIRTE